MRVSLRVIAIALALGFGLYFAMRSLWWTFPPKDPLPLLMATGLFVFALLLATVVSRRGTDVMPMWVGIMTLAVCSVLPHLVSEGLAHEDRAAPFATWFVGASGLLAVVCVVRGRTICGWGAMAGLAGGSMVHLGPRSAFELGLVGSIVWIVIAQLLVWFWGKAVADTERLVGIQQATGAWRATQRVRQRERRERVRYALTVAGPLLAQVIDTHGQLTEAERVEAHLAEGRLRDEIRAGSLLNDDVRDAIEAARRRGSTVTLFDEGRLSALSAERREQIRAELALVVQGARSERLIIRSSSDPERAVTVVGRTGGGDLPDEDAVDLWHEIGRESAARTTDVATQQE